MAEEQLYVAFKIGGVEYGTAIGVVQEVIEYTAPTRLPGTPPYVEGVIDLRGERVIPVIDLRLRLGLPPAGAGVQPRIMVLALSTVIGVVVDGVTEVLKVDPARVDPPGQAAGPVDPGYLLGVARAGGRLVPLLDLARLIGAGTAA